MNWLDILWTSGLTTLATAGLTFLLKEWISTNLKESVAAEYNKALEMFKNRIAWEDMRKQQAAELADLFSLWMRHFYYPKEDVNAIRYALQRKYWELSLYLDPPVLQAVHDALTTPAGTGTVKHIQALVKVRKLFLGADDPIRWEEMGLWPALTAEKGG